MARTGRFGRVPTEAPDLTSAIVSMMQQWQSARDSNIVDAWKNGTPFEGEKVTDGRLFAYMRDRRDDYTREEPEWDEWNTLLAEYRFNTAEQKALLRYDQAMANAAGIVSIDKSLAAQRAASSAMSSFYRGWANRVPQNSAAWREVMRSAAQFAKAAQAAKAQQARRDAAERKADRAADKPTEYERYVSRREAIYQRDVKPFSDLMGMLDNYAAATGLIQPGQTVMDLNINEQATFGALLDGLGVHGRVGGQLERLLRRAMPGSTWNGRLDLDTLDRMARRADGGFKDMIRAARGYSGDLSSEIAGFKQQQVRIGQLASLDERIDAGTLIAKGYQRLQEARASADGPQGKVDARDAYLVTLRDAKALAMRGNDPFLVGQIQAEIESWKGNTKFTTGLDDTDQQSITGSGKSRDETAREVLTDIQNATNLRDHPERYAIQATPGAADAEGTLLNSEGQAIERFSMLDRKEMPTDPKDFIFLTRDEAGHPIVRIAVGEPIFMDRLDETPDAYVAFNDGKQHIKVPSHPIIGVDPNTGEILRDETIFVPVSSDSAKDTGMRLEKVGGRYIVSGTTSERIAGLIGPHPSAGVPEYDAQVKARDTERASFMRLYMTGDVEADDEQMDAIEEILDQRYPLTRDDPISRIMPDARGPEAYRAQTTMSAENELVNYASTIIQGIAANPSTVRPGERAKVMALVAEEPGMTDKGLQQSFKDFDNIMSGAGLQARIDDAEDGSGRLTMGARAGYGSSDDVSAARWAQAVRNMSSDPAQQDRLERAFNISSRTISRVGQAAFEAVNIFGKEKPRTSLQLSAPPSPWGMQVQRTTPDIRMPANLQPLRPPIRTASGLQPSQVGMSPTLSALLPKPVAKPRSPLIGDAIRLAAQTVAQKTLAASAKRPVGYSSLASQAGIRPPSGATVGYSSLASQQAAKRPPLRTASGLRPTTSAYTSRPLYRPPGSY